MLPENYNIRRIAVDCDNTLVDFDGVHCARLNAKYGTDFTRIDGLTGRIAQVIGAKAEQDDVEEFLNGQELEKIPVLKDSYRVLSYLKVQGFYLEVVTSRPEIYRAATERMIDKNFPGIFSAITFSFNPTTPEGRKLPHKSEICKARNLDVLVDDYHKYVKECADNGIRVIFFDTTGDDRFDGDPMVKRVRSWSEIALAV